MQQPMPDPDWVAEALRSPSFLADPYPVYDRLRSSGRAQRFSYGEGQGMWLVTNYDDVDFVLKTPSIGKDITRVRDVSEEDAGFPSMISSDPPEHTRLRSLVGAAFTPKVVRDLAPRVERIAHELLDRAEEDGEFDLMSAFAMPLPVIVIAELLGVPLEDRDDFQRWSNAFIASSDATRSTKELQERNRQAQGSLAEYFGALVEARRARPQDDLVSHMVQVSDGTDRLAPSELIGTCILLLIAGHETTTNLLGNGVWTLLQHRDQWQRLVDEPDRIPAAVEEMLRYESPVQRATFRVALERVELGDVVIERGEQISAVIAAANRDPERFPDPHRFDVGREPNRHLAFGKGIHFCLGAPLARLEGAIGMRALSERFPDLAFARDEAPAWRPNTVFRGLEHLHLIVSA